MQRVEVYCLPLGRFSIIACVAFTHFLLITNFRGLHCCADIPKSLYFQVVLEKILDFTPILQRATYMGELRNNMNLFDFLMSRPGVVPRFSDRVIRAAGDFISFLGNEHEGEGCCCSNVLRASVKP